MIPYEPRNWTQAFAGLPRTPVFRRLALDLVAAGVWAALVVWVELDLLRLAVALGPSVLSVLGTILGLLLVFRTNTAYERWWEGRRVWGQIVNTTRALAHQLDALLAAGPTEGGSRDAAAREAYAAMLAAYPPALAAHLRRQRGAPGPHVPNEAVRALARRVHGDVAAGLLPREATVALTPLLTALDDATGACERIRNTPIPFSYSAYLKLFVLLYTVVLPFGLVRDLQWGAVPGTMLIFFATVGLELLAEEIEDPFGVDRNDLPTDEIAERAAGDARTLLAA